MPLEKNKDVIDILLSGKDEDSSTDIEGLDCLIYRDSSDMPKADENIFKTNTDDNEVWKVSKNNISVQVWKSKARIKVKLSPESKGNISIKRIANIAMDAILKELQKESK